MPKIETKESIEQLVIRQMNRIGELMRENEKLKKAAQNALTLIEDKISFKEGSRTEDVVDELREVLGE